MEFGSVLDSIDIDEESIVTGVLNIGKRKGTLRKYGRESDVIILWNGAKVVFSNLLEQIVENPLFENVSSKRAAKSLLVYIERVHSSGGSNKEILEEALKILRTEGSVSKRANRLKDRYNSEQIIKNVLLMGRSKDILQKLEVNSLETVLWQNKEISFHTLLTGLVTYYTKLTTLLEAQSFLVYILEGSSVEQAFVSLQKKGTVEKVEEAICEKYSRKSIEKDLHLLEELNLRNLDVNNSEQINWLGKRPIQLQTLLVGIRTYHIEINTNLEAKSLLAYLLEGNSWDVAMKRIENGESVGQKPRIKNKS